MTANAWQVFDIFYESLGAELHNLNATDTIKVALIDSSWTPNTATDVTFATVDANELGTENGYTAGGATAVMAWSATTGTLTCDTADVSWTATDDGITARYAVVWNSSAGDTNDLICYCLLDNTPADVTAAAGVDFKINMNASGLFTIAQ